VEPEIRSSLRFHIPVRIHKGRGKTQMQEMTEVQRRVGPDKQLAWQQWVKICGGNMEFAGQQWRLFWNGVRDGQLHDNCIFLINVFGYDARK